MQCLQGPLKSWINYINSLKKAKDV